MKNTYLYLSVLLCILCLIGCARYPKHYLRRFPKPVVSHSVQSSTQSYVSVNVHKFTEQECRDYFKVNLVAKGVIPLHLQINNNSNDTYIVRPSYIDIEPTEAAKVAKLLHWDTSLFVTTAGCLSIVFWWPAIFYVGSAGYNMYATNKSIDELIQANAFIGQELEILPYEVVDKFIFVDEEDFKHYFSIKLFNTCSKKISLFQISLFQNNC